MHFPHHSIRKFWFSSCYVYLDQARKKFAIQVHPPVCKLSIGYEIKVMVVMEALFVFQFLHIFYFCSPFHFIFFLFYFYFYHDFCLFYIYILDDVPKRRTLHGSRISNIIDSNDNINTNAPVSNMMSITAMPLYLNANLVSYTRHPSLYHLNCPQWGQELHTKEIKHSIKIVMKLLLIWGIHGSNTSWISLWTV